MNEQISYSVLGIGPAMVDYLLQVDHDFLARVPGPKNGMQVLDENAFQQLLQTSHVTPKRLAGGSCSNLLKGLARLGHRCALLGPIGTDDNATFFRQALSSYAITPLLLAKPVPTTRVLCLVDPHGHRTFRVAPGAARLLTPTDLPYNHFKGVQLVHLEGYSLQDSNILSTAMQHAQRTGAKISLDLSSHEIVAQFRHELLNLLRDYVDIVFCNEDEAKALSLRSAEAGCQLLRELCEIAVVSRGPDGCLVGHADGIDAFPAYPIKALDTTGAGDLFASGFLHGLLNQQPLSLIHI